MGYIAHNAIIVTTDEDRPGGLPDIGTFRASLPEDFRQLVIGPILAHDAYVSYAFMPDGIKTVGKIESEGYRARFVALFDLPQTADRQDDIIAIRYGEDHRAEHNSPSAEYVTTDPKES